MVGSRFKVVDRSTKDGYATASVEFLGDRVPEGQELLGRIHIIFWNIFYHIFNRLHDRTCALAVS